MTILVALINIFVFVFIFLFYFLNAEFIMEKKHQVHNLIILDESGSMESIKHEIIDGFNELVQTVKSVALEFPEQEHFITFVTFNSLGQRELLYCQPVEKLSYIDKNQYNPNTSTPLYDAMGYSITKLRNDLYNGPSHNVLVTIMTDGEENASRKYNSKSIKTLIEKLKTKNWTFTYIGANHDVEKTAVSISITNTFTFQKNIESIHNMFEGEKRARRRFSEKIKNHESVVEDYFKE